MKKLSLVLGIITVAAGVTMYFHRNFYSLAVMFFGFLLVFYFVSGRFMPNSMTKKKALKTIKVLLFLLNIYLALLALNLIAVFSDDINIGSGYPLFFAVLGICFNFLLLATSKESEPEQIAVIFTFVSSVFIYGLLMLFVRWVEGEWIFRILFSDM